MQPLVGTDVGAKVLSKLTRRLLPFLFVLYIVNYLDRINVGFAALQMRGQLGFSDKVYGLGAGIFFAGYFFFQVPSNLALARVGARKWIAVIMVLWGTVSASMIFVTSPRSFYLLRFLLGVTEAGFFPGIILYLRRWFPSAARARAVALFMMASPIAGVLGGPDFRRAPRSTRSASGGMAVVVPDRRTAGSSAGRGCPCLPDRPSRGCALADGRRTRVVDRATARAIRTRIPRRPDARCSPPSRTPKSGCWCWSTWVTPLAHMESVSGFRA